MKLLVSFQVHAADVKKEQSLCGHVKNETGLNIEGNYLQVSCKLCQWIMNNQLSYINEKA
jgi:uncharacterized CHY-type Zn-finger protein